jgi:hypothetical protein
MNGPIVNAEEKESFSLLWEAKPIEFEFRMRDKGDA